MLTWSPGSLFGGCVLAFGLDSGRVEDARGGAVLAKVFLQAFDGSIQLVRPDLEIDVHEICRREEESVQEHSGSQRWIQLVLVINESSYSHLIKIVSEKLIN